ncbi:hypothetical protein CERSUDRAFT_124656 [Gelatoporia subvermispora B]|uniref:Uncharacterized protein n=1 Tax=Ceriporiopsis subvermispora (strain B) TaxID=914234 RepID=M2QE26_CERS8|nr:hypothetical protein CERSUDRAFT_124656 [Gelatoporia subvermispora B]
MASQSSQSNDARPTLPSIHTLALLDIRRRRPVMDDLNDLDDLRTPRISRPLSSHLRPRNASISSEITSSSRSSSPTERAPIALPSFPFPGTNFCLVRTTFEQANAIVVVPPLLLSPVSEDSSRSRSLSPTSPTETARRGKAFLVVGEAMEQLRHSQRRLSKGARVHPYRIVPRGAGSRRASTSSAASSDA